MRWIRRWRRVVWLRRRRVLDAAQLLNGFRVDPENPLLMSMVQLLKGREEEMLGLVQLGQPELARRDLTTAALAYREAMEDVLEMVDKANETKKEKVSNE